MKLLEFKTYRCSNSEKNKLTHMGSEIGCRIQKNKFQTPIQSITWFKLDLYSKKTQNKCEMNGPTME